MVNWKDTGASNSTCLDYFASYGWKTLIQMASSICGMDDTGNQLELKDWDWAY